jgi:hypothetical protein
MEVQNENDLYENILTRYCKGILKTIPLMDLYFNFFLFNKKRIKHFPF